MLPIKVFHCNIYLNLARFKNIIKVHPVDSHVKFVEIIPIGLSVT